MISTESEFLQYLVEDPGISDANGNVVSIHAKLNELLIEEAQAGRRVIVVIDEAQNQPPRGSPATRAIRTGSKEKSRAVAVRMSDNSPRITYQIQSGDVNVTCKQVPTATPLQARAFELIGAFPVAGN